MSDAAAFVLSPAAATPTRAVWIDRLRVGLTLLVILHHATIT